MDILGEACEKTDWQVDAFASTNNHFHLVTKTPRANLVDGMQWLFGVARELSSLPTRTKTE